jgi:hypothetical protein
VHAAPNIPEPRSLLGPILREDGNQLEVEEAHLGHLNQTPGFANLSAPGECRLAIIEVALPLSVEADLVPGHAGTLSRAPRIKTALAAHPRGEPQKTAPNSPS